MNGSWTLPALVLLICACRLDAAPSAAWLRPQTLQAPPLWGVRGGLVFGLHPASVTGQGAGGPRGLIRIGYPSLPDGGYALINFIAVEPIVAGRKAFSELEVSQWDRRPGKRMTARIMDGARETIRHSAQGDEELAVEAEVEPFRNGAHVRLVLTMSADAPDELRLQVHAEPDSASLEACILTATMGAMCRVRRLWLDGGPVSAGVLYPHYRSDGFAPDRLFDGSQLFITPQGDALVAVTTDESNPAAVYPFPGSRRWHYPGLPVTQYWRAPAAKTRPGLQVRVNGRYTYWRSQRPIPGGLTFENFELREPFADGQTFIFGVTRRTPEELGLPG